jgi:hypothetical protein
MDFLYSGAMIRLDQAPIPVIVSDRKLGLEIEVDVGYNGDLNDLNHTMAGWTRHSDGSLNRGWEFVFDGPAKLDASKARVELFCSTIRDVNVHRGGGYHVHVQGHNYSKSNCYHLAWLYTKCQSVINKLVAESRASSTYCKPYDISNFRNGCAEFIRNFTSIGSQTASSRSSAKSSGNRYHTINFNMMGCATENDRSIEFRQGSVSKRFAIVFGWACFMVALTESAKNHSKVEGLPNHCQMGDLLGFLREYERESGSSNIADWVQWRYDYLNQKPDDAELRLALETVAESPIGLYGLSRKLDINLAVCRRLIDKLVEKKLIFKRTGSTAYTAAYEFKAEEDLKTLLKALSSRQNPVEG